MENMATGRQLSIFDCAPEILFTPDINDIGEAEAARIVGERVGVNFSYNDFYGGWQGKIGRMSLDLHYGHYDMSDKKDLYLSAEYIFDMGGCSMPCGGIDEAVSFFKKYIDRYTGGEKR